MIRLAKLKKEGGTVTSDIIFGVAAAKASRRIVPLLDELQEQVSFVMEGFFGLLTSYMGEDTDLASRIGTKYVAPWRALAPGYTARKGSDAFYIYTGLNRPTAAGKRSVRPGLRSPNPTTSRIAGASLIKNLAQISATRAFGAPEILNRVGPVKTKLTPRQIEDQLYLKLRSADPAVFTLRMWSEIHPTEIGTVETFLKRKGFITELNKRKLIHRTRDKSGKRQYPRPLILPFMKYWADAIMPAVVEGVLQKGMRSPTGRALPRRSATIRIPTRNYF